MTGSTSALCAAVLTAALVSVGCSRESARSTGAAQGTEWPHYAGDAGSTKYSPLDQIGPDNVQQLQVAWTWESADYGLFPDDSADTLVNPNLQTTPIMVDGSLFASTNMGLAVSLDPTTGASRWVHDPWAALGLEATGRANRGVAYWGGGDGTHAPRIFLVFGEHLTALDASDGSRAVRC
ncbi:MAG: hypothetical protein OEO23_13510, partial [Gemmatimonadota bacterium]|nr:hypothetical protein [Gemmatimonadota bacterium]